MSGLLDGWTAKKQGERQTFVKQNAWGGAGQGRTIQQCSMFHEQKDLRGLNIYGIIGTSTALHTES